MSVAQALSAARLIRTTRRRGFCPACGLFEAGSAAVGEVSAPALTALAFLALAAVAWALTIWQSTFTDGMAMGPGSLGSFAISWGVMMAAMMTPSALPLVYEFARRSEGRLRWRTATGVLVATYLGVWLLFGLVCYGVMAALPVPPELQGVVGGLALALAGLYGLTPLERAGEARCRELCALHGPLPFNLFRSAALVGARYGLSCLGCSAGLMVAMAIVGMSSLGWFAVLAALLLLYKLGLAPGVRQRLVLSAALVTLGAVYALSA